MRTGAVQREEPARGAVSYAVSIEHDISREQRWQEEADLHRAGSAGHTGRISDRADRVGWIQGAGACRSRRQDERDLRGCAGHWKTSFAAAKRRCLAVRMARMR